MIILLIFMFVFWGCDSGEEAYHNFELPEGIILRKSPICPEDDGFHEMLIINNEGVDDKLISAIQTVDCGITIGVKSSKYSPSLNMEHDIFYHLISFDNLGNIKWQESFQPIHEELIDIVETSEGDSIVLVLDDFSTSNEYFQLMKFNKNGDFLWLKKVELNICDTNTECSATIRIPG